jgi:GT2 family glycosyltransferase
MADITCITGSLPQRREMLDECVDSVRAQTVRPVAHLISVDYNLRGVEATYNQLGAMVQTEWMMCAPDDDLLDPTHLEFVGTYADEHPDIDVISTYCRCTGVGSWGEYNQPFSHDLLQRQCIVAQTALVRTARWQEIGGLPEGKAHDWFFWRWLSEHDAQFITLPEVTWTYRFHGHNLSREGVG